MLGYQPLEVLPLYKDMSTRDLLQRRVTTLDGDTTWEPSPLVNAAIHGRLVNIDNIDKLPTGTSDSNRTLL